MRGCEDEDVSGGGGLALEIRWWEDGDGKKGENDQEMSDWKRS